MYTWLEQGLFIIQWIGGILILHLSLWPVLRRWIPEYAYPVSYPASLLLFGIGTWWLGIARLPVWIVLVVFVSALVLVIRHERSALSGIRHHLTWDLLFLGFFFSMLIARIKNSAAFGNESFLDMGFISSIMRSPIVPPLDPQYAGGTLDIYYYFSHWIYGTLGLVVQVPPSVVYNLILPTTVGMAAVSCYAIGRIIIPRYPFLPLLLLVLPRPSLVAAMVSGNASDFTTALEKSVQTIPGTGNNYPWYDLLWGIPHPHINALAVQVFLLLLILILILKWEDLTTAGHRIVLFLAGMTAGVLLPVNSWDAFVYYPLLAGVFLILLRRICSSHQGAKGITSLFRSPDFLTLLVLPVTALGVFLPYLIMMHARAITGVGLVTSPSAIIPFLMVHGLYLLFFYAYLYPEIRKRPLFLLIGIFPVAAGYWSAALLLLPLVYFLLKKNRSVYDCLAVYAVFLLLLTELVYLQESLDPSSRYNTVFKISLALWPIIWISVFGMLSSFLNDPVSAFSGIMARLPVSAVVCLLICLCFIAAPVEPYFSIYSVDGRAFLEKNQPDDVRIIGYLLSTNATCLVEAAGDYDYHARIATFTGIPTIIGWPSVEEQWGRNRSEIDERVSDVQAIYHQTAGFQEFIDKYHPSYLVIGSLERIKYGNVSIGGKGLNPVFSGKSGQLFQFLA